MKPKHIWSNFCEGNCRYQCASPVFFLVSGSVATGSLSKVSVSSQVARALMMKTRCIGRIQLRLHRMFAEMFERPSYILQKQRAKVPADPMAHENTLNHLSLAIGRQRVGRDLPAPSAQAICQVIKIETRICTLPYFPAERGNTCFHIAIIDNFKRTQFLYFSGKVDGGFITGGMNSTVPFSAQAQKIVVLAGNLSSWP